MNHLALIGLAGFLLLLLIGILGAYVALIIKFPDPRLHDSGNRSRIAGYFGKSRRK